FIAEGTTCESCAEIIKRQALKVEGVKSATFDYATEKGNVEFDPEKTDIDTILYKIEEKGYRCFILDNDKTEKKSSRHAGSGVPRTLGWISAILGIAIALYFLVHVMGGVELPAISQNMGYGLLFVVGLLTGFHCIAMCGGFVVSYTAKDAQAGRKSHKSHVLYGLGKIVSYTLIGAAFGLLGSIITFTPAMRGIAGLLAGLFLVVFGLKMLNIFPALRRFSLKTPQFLNRFVGKNQSSSPLVIGLLNGLMIACGPLQAIYIMAAGTGSVVEGAKLLFIFAVGTLPVMLGFGYFASLISSRMTNKILRASGVIVIILGIIMVNRGLSLTGTGYDFGSIVESVSAEDLTGKTVGVVNSNVPLMNNGYQEINMDVTARGWEPDRFVLKKGVPVKWIINGKEITGCNKAIQVPSLGLSFDIKQGTQTIEFTPTESGTIPWSCWMGMIRGTFIVKDDLDTGDAAAVQQELDSAAASAPSAGSCGMGAGGGGCGCGG
ncbi:sulfite exporter TauE/SafE family protein, partial [Candidatus Woesearchaeota archaeon]|nr:sulfite exporter TauE/SafE family protein [Candidatus Woesearchaeota archaeon]